MTTFDALSEIRVACGMVGKEGLDRPESPIFCNLILKFTVATLGSFGVSRKGSVQCMNGNKLFSFLGEGAF